MQRGNRFDGCVNETGNISCDLDVKRLRRRTMIFFLRRSVERADHPMIVLPAVVPTLAIMEFGAGSGMRRVGKTLSRAAPQVEVHFSDLAESEVPALPETDLLVTHPSTSASGPGATCIAAYLRYSGSVGPALPASAWRSRRVHQRVNPEVAAPTGPREAAPADHRVRVAPLAAAQVPEPGPRRAAAEEQAADRRRPGQWVAEGWDPGERRRPAVPASAVNPDRVVRPAQEAALAAAEAARAVRAARASEAQAA